MTMRRSVAGAVLAALAWACTPESTTPSAVEAQLAAAGGRWHFNSERYRDAGAKPATGRSGAAAVAAEAFADGSGLTRLFVTSFRAGDLTAPAGDIVRVQIKAFGDGGALLLVRNVAATGGAAFETALAGLAPGVTLQVTAQVRGVDGRRTDVVTVGGIAILPAPDLAVLAVGAPAAAIVGLPVIVTATVAELAGVRGARADCVLLADGVEVDRARGIWVDAGDAVTCAFTPTFATAGPRTLSVQVANVSPLDGNAANNASTAGLTVATADGAPPVSAAAEFRSGTYSIVDTFSTRWTYPSGALFQEIASSYREGGTTQFFMASGVIGAPLTFPLARVDVGQATGGLVTHTARWDGLPQIGGSGCASAGVGTGTDFFLCTGGGAAVFTYTRAAGTVTYQSSEYAKVWNGTGYDEDTWVDNGVLADLPVAPLGPTYAFSVSVSSGGRVYQAAGVMDVVPLVEAEDEPLACATGTVSLPPDVFEVTTCTGFAYAFTGYAGSFTGAGAVGTP